MMTEIQVSGSERSGASRLNIAKNVTVPAQKYDAMPGRIGFVPFELVVWNLDLRSDVNMRPAARFVRTVVGDHSIGLAVANMDFVRPIGVGLATARGCGHIRLHQRLIPLPDFQVRSIPLPEVTGHSTSMQIAENTEKKDDSLHPSRSFVVRREGQSNVHAAVRQLRAPSGLETSGRCDDHECGTADPIDRDRGSALRALRRRGIRSTHGN